MVKKILLTFLALIVLGGGIYIYKIYQDTVSLKVDSQTKEKALKEILGHDPIVPKAPVLGDQSYEGKYFTLQYPKSAVIYHRDPTYQPGKDELENLIFQELQPKLFFVVSVLDRPEIYQLNDFPSVSQRLKDTDLYSSQTIQEGGVSGIEFIKLKPSPDTNQLEKSAFFMKTGHVYSFALTGIDIDEINALFDKVIGSVQFK